MADGYPLLVVAAAMIDRDGRVLVQQRPDGRSHAGLWEFPGGKLERGEAPEAALARELAEELGIVIDLGAAEPAFFATARSDGGPLVLLLYLVRRWTGEPRALEAPAVRWAMPTEIAALPMPPADGPLVAWLCRVLA